MIEIERAQLQSVELAHNAVISYPAMAWQARDDGEPVASWGLTWVEGRCFLFFEMLHSKPGYRWIVVRQARLALRRAAQVGESEVYTPRDAQHITSERLLRALKFEPYSVENGIEVWRCLVSN